MQFQTEGSGQADTPDRALATLAAGQHGVLSLRQATALGISRRTIARWVQSGRLAEVVPGVHMVAGSPLTWHAQLMALTLQTGGAASHRSAARLHRFDTLRTAPDLEVSVAHGRGSRLGLGTVHQTRAPELMAVSRIDGIPCVGAARALVDLAAVLGTFRLARAVDDLRRLGILQDVALVEAYILHRRRGRPGMKKLNAVLDDQLGTEVTDSTFEFLVLSLLKDAGLPAPVVHHRVDDSAGDFIAEIDLAYPRLKIAIELDSKAHHFNLVSFEKDPRKKNRLTQEGWFVLTITWGMLKDDPAGLVRMIAKAIEVQASRR